jgi:hypothetical protein
MRGGLVDNAGQCAKLLGRGLASGQTGAGPHANRYFLVHREMARPIKWDLFGAGNSGRSNFTWLDTGLT